MTPPKSAIVAGHICLDITPIFPERTLSAESVLRPGKLTHVHGVNVHVGGAVANTGLAMRVLGAPVRLIGKIGDDEFGAIVRAALEEHDAADDMIVSQDTQTSYSVVLAIPGIDRMFIHHPGANDCFRSSDLDPSVLDGTTLFHFGYPPLMASMYENDGAELVKLLQSVREADIAVSLDMAAVDSSTGAGAADWKAILQRALPYVDFFVPSAEEICFMLDRDRYDEWMTRAAGSDVCEVIGADDVMPLAEQIISLGAKVALIKCGAAGIYCKTASAKRMTSLCRKLGLSLSDWVDREVCEACYVPDVIRSGTGAGDTCIAAFLVSVLKGEPLSEALHLAAAIGACCVESYDALSGLKPLAEVKARIRNGWKKRE